MPDLDLLLLLPPDLLRLLEKLPSFKSSPRNEKLPRCPGIVPEYEEMLSRCPEYEEETLSLFPACEDSLSLRPRLPWIVTLSLWLCKPGWRDMLSLLSLGSLEDNLSVLPEVEERLSALLLASEENEALSIKSDRPP